jgi:hypothetical protein
MHVRRSHLLLCATAARQAGVTIPADAVFSRSNHAPIKLPVLWLHHHLHAMLVDKFVPLFTSRLFEGEMELDVRLPHAHAPPHSCMH